MRVKSAFPPICFESPITGRKYIVCTGGKESSGWVEVKRYYGWAELEGMWDKIEYSAKPKVEKTKRKEYKVKGSKGNVYKVVSDEGVWTCSCPAHGFGRGKDCKHIILLKTKNKK